MKKIGCKVLSKELIRSNISKDIDHIGINIALQLEIDGGD